MKTPHKSQQQLKEFRFWAIKEELYDLSQTRELYSWAYISITTFGSLLLCTLFLLPPFGFIRYLLMLFLTSLMIPYILFFQYQKRRLQQQRYSLYQSMNCLKEPETCSLPETII